MDFSSSIILTHFKCHEWKGNIGILLRNKGLYRVSMTLENEPNVVVEKEKWHNRMDEAYGFVCFSIYPDLLFHTDELTAPNQVCTKIEFLF